MHIQLIQIAVLPKLTSGAVTAYILLGVDANGAIWKRDAGTNSWTKDDATFNDN